jgi:sporulation protein YlmC with PRC-barrel domain
MLMSFQDLRGYGIHATDGDIGSVRDVYFDEATSAIRYLVVDTGSWLPGRRVLLAPAAAGAVDHAGQAITTALTRRQVEDSPAAETDQPVSRQHEEALYRHYGWDPYWDGAMAYGVAPYWGGMGLAAVPPVVAENPAERDLAEREAAGGERGDPRLRIAHEVVGYYVAASDGDIGHVEDLLIEADRWAVRQLVIDTRNWLPGTKVVVGPDRLRSVDWTDRHIVLDMTRAEVKASPEYDPAMTEPRA